ncbi:Pentatricopeptide repeat-containing protein [Cynara cardunculus var. scolymus]|uniref:Pentatricopeptide repeat-containing protein n=1 Tax=Cynara cardunculus var. scolymus TaxID=59895 RepID=A0A103YLL1_CYNCS|nr:Pentatricopeptide repeat-containing protein [Cynara cardunculus var. scolymus]
MLITVTISTSIRKQLSSKGFSQIRYFSIIRPEKAPENKQEPEIERPIHEDVFKSGQKLGSFKVGDPTFYSLIENFSKTGDLISLAKVFNQMKRERRVFIERNFILVFKAYGKAKKAENALDLFDKMWVEYQCRPSVRSFNSVINVAIQEGLFSRALEFYSSVVIRDKRVLPNVLTYNLILKVLCRLRLIDRAIETFREMPVRKCTPDVFTYCTLMDGLCKEDRIDEAVCLLDEMQVEGCFPTAVTFNVLINGLCKKGDLARAANVVENMFLKGCVPNEATYNTLIHGLCLKGKLEKAVSLLDRMVRNKCIPNDVTYGTIINGLVKQGRAVDGAHMLVSMEERGLKANQYVYSTLISGLFKEGKPKEALNMWKEMISKGCKPNTVLYGTLIDGLCGEMKPDEAKDVLLEMDKVGCKPNAFIYSSLMKGFFNMGNSDKALSLWKEVASNDCVQNEVCYSVLIHGLCSDGKLEEARMFWEEMLLNGYRPDVVAYSSLIHGLCSDGFVEEGLKLFNEMLCAGSGSQPDIITYNILSNALCKHGRISHAIDLLNNMLDRGCDPDLVTCNIFLKTLKEHTNGSQDGSEFLEELVLRLHKRRQVAGASKIIEVMLQKYLTPKTSTWEIVIQELCKPKKVIGGSMWFSESLFLVQSWAKDESTLKLALQSLKHYPQPFWLALFVEGTLFTKAKLLAAQDSIVNGVALSQMKSFVPAIIDMTVSIPKDSTPPTMLWLFKGQSSVIHVKVTRHSMKDVPESDEAVAQWCKDKFIVKWSDLLSSWKGLTFTAVGLAIVTILMHILIQFSQLEHSTPTKVSPVSSSNGTVLATFQRFPTMMLMVALSKGCGGFDFSSSAIVGSNHGGFVAHDRGGSDGGMVWFGCFSIVLVLHYKRND